MTGLPWPMVKHACRKVPAVIIFTVVFCFLTAWNLKYFKFQQNSGRFQTYGRKDQYFSEQGDATDDYEMSDGDKLIVRGTDEIRRKIWANNKVLVDHGKNLTGTTINTTTVPVTIKTVTPRISFNAKDLGASIQKISFNEKKQRMHKLKSAYSWPTDCVVNARIGGMLLLFSNFHNDTLSPFFQSESDKSFDAYIAETCEDGGRSVAAGTQEILRTFMFDGTQPKQLSANSAPLEIPASNKTYARVLIYNPFHDWSKRTFSVLVNNSKVHLKMNKNISAEAYAAEGSDASWITFSVKMQPYEMTEIRIQAEQNPVHTKVLNVSRSGKSCRVGYGRAVLDFADDGRFPEIEGLLSDIMIVSNSTSTSAWNLNSCMYGHISSAAVMGNEDTQLRYHAHSDNAGVFHIEVTGRDLRGAALYLVFNDTLETKYYKDYFNKKITKINKNSGQLFDVEVLIAETPAKRVTIVFGAVPTVDVVDDGFRVSLNGPLKFNVVIENPRKKRAASSDPPVLSFAALASLRELRHPLRMFTAPVNTSVSFGIFPYDADWSCDVDILGYTAVSKKEGFLFLQQVGIDLNMELNGCKQHMDFQSVLDTLNIISRGATYTGTGDNRYLAIKTKSEFKSFFQNSTTGIETLKFGF